MAGHSWKFFRAGGFDQVLFETGAELGMLDQLDQKLWVALACPVKGLEFDQRTLELLDDDKDGRIRAHELINAGKWAVDLLKYPDELLKAPDSLRLDEIDESKPTGKLLADAARKLLASMGKGTATALSVDDASQAQKAFEAQPFNGDGVVPADSAADPELKAAVEEVIKTVGSAPDKSGKPGLNQSHLDLFAQEAAAYLAWHAKGVADPAVLPLAEKTFAAYAAYAEVQAKIDDYFARCRTAAFDPRSTSALNRDEKDYAALSVKQLDAGATELVPFPLAPIAPKQSLPLGNGVNPAWSKAIAAFNTSTVEPLLGGTHATLTEAEFETLKARFAPHQAWLAAKQGALVEPLGIERVKLLAGPLMEKLKALLAEDLAVESVAKSITEVEKLVRLHRDLIRLANNFVAFKDFYSRHRPAIFQAGTLYLDTRAFELCIKVDDPARHANLAPLSRAYLMYCDAVRPASSEKMTLVAVVSAGDVDNLMVGRNGIFYDRKGRDWDVTVNKIIDQPISIKQAFWSPYKKLIRFVEEQIAKRAGDAAAASDASLLGTAAGVNQAATTGTPPPAVPKKLDIGVVAALGVAVGGITAALGAILQAFFGLGVWMPIGLVGLILLISGPSMAVAWLKLRQRNIGPLLDASGWAVNAVAKLNVPFGRSLTQEAKLPPNARRDLTDPFAEKSKAWIFWLILVVVLGGGFSWFMGWFDSFLPERIQSHAVKADVAKLPAKLPTVPTPAPAPAAPAPTPAPAAPK